MSRRVVPIDEAIDRLVPEGAGDVHTFYNPAVNMLLGADHPRDSLIRKMRLGVVEEAGEQVTPKELVEDMRKLWVNDSPRMKHGTHWEGCYVAHAACAIERLCQMVEQLADAGCEGRCGHGKENVE